MTLITTTDGVQQLDHLIPLLGGVVDRIRDDQLDAPTPCDRFTVTGILEHMIAGATTSAPAFRGEPPVRAPAPSPAAPGLALKARWRSAMIDLLAAVWSPGAQERTISSPFGEVSGTDFARYAAFDAVVHGWDLATATHQAYDPPTVMVADIDAFARRLIGDEMRDGDTFAVEAVPSEDATPIERLVAFSGRTLMSKAPA